MKLFLLFFIIVVISGIRNDVLCKNSDFTFIPKKIEPDSLKNYKPIGTISINPMDIIFYNFSIYYERAVKNSSKFGVSIGYKGIYNIPTYKRVDNYNNIKYYSFIFYMIPELTYELGHAIIFDSDNFPTNAYQGPELKLNFQTKMDVNHENSWYVGPEIIFKYLFYKNKTFSDNLGTNRPEFISYTRDEKAFIIGYGIVFSKDFYKKRSFTQLSFGIGMRTKIRDINTTKHSGDVSYLVERRPLGEKHSIIYLPTINFGVKFGRVIKFK